MTLYEMFLTKLSPCMLLLPYFLIIFENVSSSFCSYKIHGNFLSNSFVFFKFPARLCKFSPPRVINPKTLSIFSTIVWQERKNEGAWESLIYHPIPTVYGTLVGQIWKKFNFCKSSLKVIKWKWYLHNTFTSPTQWIFIENLIFLTVYIVHRRNRR